MPGARARPSDGSGHLTVGTGSPRARRVTRPRARISGAGGVSSPPLSPAPRPRRWGRTKVSPAGSTRPEAAARAQASRRSAPVPQERSRPDSRAGCGSVRTAPARSSWPGAVPVSGRFSAPVVSSPAGGEGGQSTHPQIRPEGRSATQSSFISPHGGERNDRAGVHRTPAPSCFSDPCTGPPDRCTSETGRCAPPFRRQRGFHRGGTVRWTVPRSSGPVHGLHAPVRPGFRDQDGAGREPGAGPLCPTARWGGH